MKTVTMSNLGQLLLRAFGCRSLLARGTGILPVRRPFLAGCVAFIASLLALAPLARAQQQFQGVCANVKIVIQQELAIERIGFEATLEITNNVGGDPITDFSAALTFSDPSNTTDGVAADAGDLFFVQQPRMTEVNAVDGTGVIGPTKTAVIKWFIIPKPGAGGALPQGKQYSVGVNMSGKMGGVEIPKTIFYAIPDTITVKPEPELEIRYFQPRDVQGDDPFTPEVESPIPFTLGVLVKNSGYGTARKVNINSQQPKIVENEKGLVLVARLLGTRVQDSPLNEASLQVNLGDIPPGQTRKGAWDMITSLSGEFIEFKASYTHRDDLGGLETSLIKTLEAHFIAHEVLNDDPGRDSILDFLADTDRDALQLPDTLYESEGQILPVNAESDASVTTPLSNRTFTITVNRQFEGWGYVRMDDPGQAKLQIQSVVRNDGRVVNLHNVWTNIRYRYPDNAKLTYLNLFDKVATPGTYTYTITYANPPPDTMPPVTRLRFSGQVTQSSGNYYITRDTQMYFTSDDASPVNIEYELDDATTFSPAIPFTISTPGAHIVRFRATDSAGNVEATQTASLVLPSAGPAFGDINVGSDALTLTGDTMSFRATQIALSIPVATSSVNVGAQVDVFRGVRVWPTLAGVPVSPTSSGTTALAVGGLNVDFYKYRVNGGAWSAERAVATPISLSGLSGSVSLDVLGRSQFGGYPADSAALHAAWTVDAQAPQFTLSGLPPVPTRYPIPSVTVAAPGVDLYKWTYDDSYYRAQAAPGTSFTVPDLAPGSHTLKLLAQRGGTWQSESSPTTWSWVYDPAYGSDLSSLTKVYSQSYPAAQGTTLAFSWDGRDNAGIAQLPGYYTVRVQLTDELGNTTFTTKVVHIDDLVTSASALTDLSAGGEKPDARGNWLVWQERGSGTPNIRARNVGPAGGITLALTNGTLNQENPRTDGRNVVWQGRRDNGNWDIYYADLTDPTHVVALTDTPTKNEINPVIDWPWVVWQVKDTSNANAPWQLQAANMETGQLFMVNPSAADQLDPAVQAGRVVWQDFRDVGYGEIYFRDLETGQQRRLTNNGFGQYAPDIQGNWVVWQDNRNTEVDVYGYDLRRMTETRLTTTSANEARPRIAGNWVLFTEDSAGVLSDNFVLLDLSTGHSVPLTRTASKKSSGMIAGGQLFWQDGTSGQSVVMGAAVPALQSVFRNYNAVPITPALVGKYGNAYALLQAWNAEAGVVALTRFKSFAPLATDVATISGGTPGGTNFTLNAGEFVWVRFNDNRLLDLGDAGNGPLNLPAGTSAFTRTQLPVNYTGYALARSLGLANLRGLRVLDAEAGQWRTLAVDNGAIIGPDFKVPTVAVVIVDLNTAINGWAP
jgi:beta propeller repeat protein